MIPVPKRPEEGIRSLEVEVTGSCESRSRDSGNKTQVLCKIATACNPWAISPVPRLFKIFFLTSAFGMCECECTEEQKSAWIPWVWELSSQLFSLVVVTGYVRGWFATSLAGILTMSTHNSAVQCGKLPGLLWDIPSDILFPKGQSCNLLRICLNGSLFSSNFPVYKHSLLFHSNLSSKNSVNETTKMIRTLNIACSMTCSLTSTLMATCAMDNSNNERERQRLCLDKDWYIHFLYTVS